MNWINCAKVFVRRVSFGNWRLEVFPDGHNRAYLQVQADEPCVVTGKLHTWHGRKWRLSEHMTGSELVNTACLAIMTAVEHETRENIKYRGVAIFGPHHNVEALRALTEADNAIDVRPPRQDQGAS